MRQSDIPKLICDKHQMVLDLVQAAMEDGQSMETALRERKKTIAELEERILELEQEVADLQDDKEALEQELEELRG